MKKRESVFITRSTAKALMQTKRTISEAKKLLTDTQENITRANTELLGIYPYILPYVAYMFENNKEMIIEGDPKGTHYQIGTAENPIPFYHICKNTIGTFPNVLKPIIKKQELSIEKILQREKQELKIELYRMIKQKRTYWLQDKDSGNYILDEPIRIIPVADNSIISIS